MITGGFLIALIFLEIIFRFLPVAGIFSMPKIDSNNPVLRLRAKQNITHSLGWNLYNITNKSSNNYGYLSDIDYRRGGRPLAVIIGDSYIAAMQVDNKESLGGLLADSFPTEKVYSVGISGAPLSQYLAFAEFAESEFEPQSYVFVVVSNDFDESVCSIRPQVGHHCFDENLSNQLIPFHGFSFLRSLARSSALLRYIVFNLGMDWRRAAKEFNVFSSEISDERYAANTLAKQSPEVTSKSRAVIDRFLLEISGLVKGKPVAIVIDADRAAIYSEGIEGSYFSEMRRHLMSQAKKYGFEIVDMKPVFEEHYKNNKEKFNFPTDGHWNKLAHFLAANELAALKQFQR